MKFKWSWDKKFCSRRCTSLHAAILCRERSAKMTPEERSLKFGTFKGKTFSAEAIEKIRQSKLGNKNPMRRLKGTIRRSMETRKRMSDARKYFYLTPQGIEWRHTFRNKFPVTLAMKKKLSSRQKKWYKTEDGKNAKRNASNRMREHNPMKISQVREKMSATMKQRIASGEIVPYLVKKSKEKDVDFWNDFIRKSARARSIRPNKVETKLDGTIQEIIPHFKYVGDAKIFVGMKNPDWIDDKSKKIIEMFGCYTHGCRIHCPNSPHRDNSQDRSEYFKQFGYETLIIWEHEMKDNSSLIKKLEEFNVMG